MRIVAQMRWQKRQQLVRRSVAHRARSDSDGAAGAVDLLIDARGVRRRFARSKPGCRRLAAPRRTTSACHTRRRGPRDGMVIMSVHWRLAGHARGPAARSGARAVERLNAGSSHRHAERPPLWHPGGLRSHRPTMPRSFSTGESAAAGSAVDNLPSGRPDAAFAGRAGAQIFRIGRRRASRRAPFANVRLTPRCVLGAVRPRRQVVASTTACTVLGCDLFAAPWARGIVATGPATPSLTKSDAPNASPATGSRPSSSLWIGSSARWSASLPSG